MTEAFAYLLANPPMPGEVIGCMVCVGSIWLWVKGN